MPRNNTDIRSLARSHTETAINVLAGIMNEPQSAPAARVNAAQALLDRGWGKPVQGLEHTGLDGADLSLVVKLISANKD